MLLLIIGLVIWIAAHLLRSLAPQLRKNLQDRLGSASKGLMTIIILLSLGLIVAGYKSAGFVPVWTPPLWMTHINNALMIIATYMYFTTATKPGTAFLFGSLKNPQLTGFKVWAFGHLLVNGDLASMVLFGGLLAWAVVQVIAAKRAPSLVDRDTAKITSPWVHLALVVAAFAAFTFIHTWAGVWPFGHSAG